MRRTGPRRSWTPILVILVLGLSGCAFTTIDVYRPLVLSEFPNAERSEILRSTYFEDVEPESFLASLDRTRIAWKGWIVHKYNSYFADLDIGKLVEALAHHPDNPFAWSQLGAYMALQHRPDAAAEATERTLAVLDRLGELGGAPELRELRQVSVVNLAIYHNTAGRPGSALQALSRLDPAALAPFHRLAYQWAAAQAHTALGDVGASREALRAARAVAADGLEQVPGRADYPQYFEPRRREALFRYLEASNLRMERRYEEALSTLDEALAGPRAVSDPKLLDARFLKAQVFRETGSLDRAVVELEALVEQVPPRLFRREAIYYQLAFARIEQQELVEAQNALARAVEITRHENGALRRKLERALGAPPAESSDVPETLFRVVRSAYEDEGWRYSPAFEALGEAYLDAFTSSGRGNPLLVAEAERMFQVALGERGFPEDRDHRLPGGGGEIEPFALTQAARLGPGARLSSPVTDPGRYDRARGAAFPGAESSERRFRTLGRLAKVQWAADDTEPALARFAEALGSAPDDSRNLASLIELGSRASEPVLARRAYDLVLEYLPLQAAPFGIQPSLGQELRQALAEAPQAEGSQELDHLRARLVLLVGDLDAATAAFDAAAREHSEALWPATGLAWIDLNRDSVNGVAAVQRLDRGLASALESTPTWQRRDAHFVRGELRLLTGDPAAALADFEAAAELEPTWTLAGEGVRLAREKLASGEPEL